MKTKFLFTVIATLIFASSSLAVSVDLNCKRPSGLEGFAGGTHFYSTFLSVSNQISGAYTYLYQAVDDHVETKLRQICKRKISKVDKLTFLRKSCFSGCSAEVKRFHNEVIKTRAFKRSKIKKQTKSCKEVCDYSYRLQKSGHDETATGVFGKMVRSLPAE